MPPKKTDYIDDELQCFLLEYLSENYDFFTFFESPKKSKPLNQFKLDLENLYADSIIITYFSLDFANTNIKHSIKLLKEHKPENIEKLCNILVNWSPHYLKSIPKEFQTQELCLLALSRMANTFANPLPKVLRYIKDPETKILIKLLGGSLG